jgi:HSP20 family molecular chaperone IbpA
MNHFTEDGWYCTRGPAKEMVTMMDTLMGQAKQITRIEPDGTMRIDEKTRTVAVTVELPGVAQKDINLRIRDSGFTLTARRDEVEFFDSHDFGCLVNPEEAKVTFKDGVLAFHIPVKSKLSENKKEENR